jgi:hypothetical protein
MLGELLRVLEQSEEGMELSELGRRLGAQPGAVAGMLETLARKGRVEELQPACGPCEGCRLAGGCDLPPGALRRYRLARPPRP